VTIQGCNKDKKSGRIIYGEAGKDFVDLILPIGCVLKLLCASEGAEIVGSVSILYESLDKLPSGLMDRDKSELLNPNVISSYSPTILKIDYGDNFYICADNMSDFYCYTTDSYSSTHTISKGPGEKCACGHTWSRIVQFRHQGTAKINNQGAVEGSIDGGYVKETVTFIITDDLKVMPSSAIASITLLNRLNISDISQLEERNAYVGLDKVTTYF
ncbi:hypothetical protein KI387_037617, partial [Taxus chinensis]